MSRGAGFAVLAMNNRTRKSTRPATPNAALIAEAARLADTAARAVFAQREFAAWAIEVSRNRASTAREIETATLAYYAARDCAMKAREAAHAAALRTA